MGKAGNQPTVAVLGAGNGGQALSAYLSLKGVTVNLYELPQFGEGIAPLKKLGGVELEGVVASGFAKLNKITSDIREAIKGVNLIMLAVPAFGHRQFFENCLPHLEEGQIFVIMPGNYGALELGNMLKAVGKERSVTVAEIESLFGATKRTGPTRVNLFAVKDTFRIAAFPAIRTDKVLETFKKIFPQVTPAENTLETSMNNVNAIGHPVPMVLNAGWIEYTKGNFSFFREGITPSVAKVMEKLDQERLDVAKAIGIKAVSCKDLLISYYGVKGESLYDVIQNHERRKIEKELRPEEATRSPDSLKARFLSEEIPFALVPLASLGKLVNTPTPIINAHIELASVMNGVNYWDEGRTVEKLGLKGLTGAKILQYVKDGFVK